MNTNMTGFRCFSLILAFCALDESSLSFGRVPPEIATWIYDTFDNNFGIKDTGSAVFVSW